MEEKSAKCTFQHMDEIGNDRVSFVLREQAGCVLKRPKNRPPASYRASIRCAACLGGLSTRRSSLPAAKYLYTWSRFAKYLTPWRPAVVLFFFVLARKSRDLAVDFQSWALVVILNLITLKIYFLKYFSFSIKEIWLGCFFVIGPARLKGRLLFL